MKQKLTLFERLLLLVINEIMYLAGISAKDSRELRDLLYEIAFRGEIKENDLDIFR